MYFISNLWGCAPNLFFSRGISCTSSCHANHYVTLGVTPGSSQEEIKAAYFELCKKYHPDKNDGSEESTKLFRTISEAYKVLGNEKLRKSYDQKMGYGRAGRELQWDEKCREDYNYESERNLYERNNLRRRRTGKTWYYNFDAWNNAHYPNIKHQNINYSENQRKAWRSREQSEFVAHHMKYYARLSLHILMCVLFGSMLFSILRPSSYSSFNYGISNEMKVKKEKNENKKCDVHN